MNGKASGSVAALIDTVNDNAPPCLGALNGAVAGWDAAARELTMTFDMPLAYCHSGNVVQGGFVTAMLDAAMAHAVIFELGQPVPVPTLDLSVHFLAPTLAGPQRAVGRALRLGSRVGFVEAWLYDPNGDATAKATSSVIVTRTT